MKKFVFIILFWSMLLLLTACSSHIEKQEYQRYSSNFLGTFDTLVQIIGYTKSEEEFLGYANDIQIRFQEFHRLYDKFNDYEGINNIKTINDNAGIKPVKVEQEIIDLILFSKKWHEHTHGKLNIAIGSLLEIWDDKMNHAMENSEQTFLPSIEILQAASKHGDMEKIVVDTEAMTVFLADKEMSLDVGAIGKGFAAQQVGREMVEKGFTSGVIISGGNWKVLGKPREPDRDYWIVGIQNPDKPYALNEEGILEKVFIKGYSIDTSGDYQRYVMIEGIRVHHIIDPETLMPGNYHRGVTVLAYDSVVADYLSTELFLLPYEQGRALVDSLEGIEALWVMKDGTIKATKAIQDSINSESIVVE